MYTTTNATRDQALLAAAAAERAMKRQECCKSQFKFKCFSCGEMINRGDKITKCTAPCWDGMRLRFRGADARNGLKQGEVAFYLAETGTRTWVHIECIPCYWDSLPEGNPEYSLPALRSAHTDWGCKISYEFDEWRQRTNHYDMEEFLEKHGYPQDKWMKDRIVRAVTRFQAIWRGYLYKRALPLALTQRKREFLKWCGSLPMDEFRSFPLFCQLRQTLNYGPLPETLNEFAENIITQRTREREEFFYNNHIGTQFDILMDVCSAGAAIYSAKVVNHTSKYMVANGESHLYFWVKYHHDDEVRKYHWKRLLTLQLECEAFKSKHGILCCGPTGKMPVALYIKTRKTKNKKQKNKKQKNKKQKNKKQKNKKEIKSKKTKSKKTKKK